MSVLIFVTGLRRLGVFVLLWPCFLQTTASWGQDAAPIIISQPQNVNLLPRTFASISVTAAGTQPLGYQWRLNGSPIAGATNRVFPVYGEATNAGLYEVLVHNAYGSVTSALAMVSINITVIDGWSPEANAAVHATAIQADGKVVVGGSFTALDTYARNRIGRVLADGSVDSQFNPNANGDVYCILQQPDGALVVGGAFTSLGGRSCRYLGRLNLDGSLDTNFTVTAKGTVYCLGWQPDGRLLAGGASTLVRFDQNGTVDASFTPNVIGTIYSLAARKDGGILVGGAFSSIAGSGRQNLARVNSNGTLDASYDLPVVGTVYCMALEQGDSVLLGGTFSKIGQQTRVNVARLENGGEVSPQFNPGASNTVYTLALQVDGRILVGGSFTSLAGVPRFYLGRINSDGSADPLFNPTANQTVYSLALQGNGKVVAGGLFSSFRGAARKYLARLDATGDAGQSLAAEIGMITWRRGGALPEVEDVRFYTYAAAAGWIPLGVGQRISGGWQVAGTVEPGSNLRAQGRAAGGRGGGSGSMIQFVVGPVVITSEPEGRNITSPFSTVLSVEVSGSGPFTYQWYRNGVAIASGTDAVYPNGSLGSYQVTVCNEFGCVQSKVATIWRVNSAENTTRPNPDSSVYSLAVQADGKVLLGGSFTNAWGTPRRGLARLNADGSLDPRFDPDVEGSVLCLAVLPDARILLGGNFTSVGGQSRSCLALVNQNGSLDTSFIVNAAGGAFGTAVYCLSPQDDGKILVGGSFSTIAGQSRNCLTRVEANGTADPGFVPSVNLHPQKEVNSILQRSDGLILLGGRFGVSPNTYHNWQWVQANGSYAGSGYSGPLVGSSVVYAMLAQTDGKVLLGGFDLRVDAQPGRSLRRLNADRSVDTTFTASADGPVLCFAAQADGKVLVGGGFSLLNGVARSGLGRFNADGSLDTGFNPGFTGTNTGVYGVAALMDGKVCAGGTFTNVGSSTRYNFARLPAAAFVSEDWTYDGSTLLWRRAGPPVELDSVTLESSSDGATWQSFAQGTRVADTWQFTGVSLPFGPQVRARGEVVSSGINTWQTGTLLKALDIITQPLSRTNGLGSIAGFYVAVQGPGPFSYQWFRNGVALQDGGPIAGARAPLLTFRVDDLLGGDYQVAVTNLFGSVTSSVARLGCFDPSTPPVILTDEPACGFYTNCFTFRIQGLPGQTCVIERSETMKFWSAVVTNVLTSPTPVIFTDPSNPATQQFYRVRLQ